MRTIAIRNFLSCRQTICEHNFIFVKWTRKTKKLFVVVISAFSSIKCVFFYILSSTIRVYCNWYVTHSEIIYFGVYFSLFIEIRVRIDSFVSFIFLQNEYNLIKVNKNRKMIVYRSRNFHLFQIHFIYSSIVCCCSFFLSKIKHYNKRIMEESEKRARNSVCWTPFKILHKK